MRRSIDVGPTLSSELVLGQDKTTTIVGDDVEDGLTERPVAELHESTDEGLELRARVGAQHRRSTWHVEDDGVGAMLQVFIEVSAGELGVGIA